MPTINGQVQSLTETGSALGGVGLLIVEKRPDAESAIGQAEKQLRTAGYDPVQDYLAILDALNAKRRKIFYVERDARLDGSVLEIVAEFEAGLVSLADHQGPRGLVTASFNSAATSFVVVLTRAQVEKSHPRLLSYARFSQAI